jgi:hypothetical protein
MWAPTQHNPYNLKVARHEIREKHLQHAVKGVFRGSLGGKGVRGVGVVVVRLSKRGLAEDIVRQRDLRRDERETSGWG